jgi:hypothetical protein
VRGDESLDVLSRLERPHGQGETTFAHLLGHAETRQCLVDRPVAGQRFVDAEAHDPDSLWPKAIINQAAPQVLGSHQYANVISSTDQLESSLVKARASTGGERGVVSPEQVLDRE